MAVKKESVEIKCPDCKIEFRLWVPATHLTLWEGDEGERVNCVRCPTRFKIRKTIDGTKVFKLQRKVKEEPKTQPAPTKEIPSEPTLDIAFEKAENSAQTLPPDLNKTVGQVKEEPAQKPTKEPAPVANTPEEKTPEPTKIPTPEPIVEPTPVAPATPVQQMEEVEEEVIEIEAVELEEVSTMGLTQHGETVLFVEDDKLSMAVAENSLIDLNINLLTAGSGEEALDIINSTHIDLLITDLHLIDPEKPESKIDGENLLQIVSDKGFGIPAIVTTGKEMIDDIVMDPRWFPLNVKGFVQKGSPFWSEELKDKVKEIINKPG